MWGYVLFVFLCVSSGYCLSDPRCDEGWEYHDSRCYLFVKNITTYPEAKAACKGKGALPLCISGPEENDFIAQKLRHYFQKAWIGLTKSADPCPDGDPYCLWRDWACEDDTAYQYQQWHEWYASYEPRTSYNCAQLDSYEQAWDGFPCTSTRRYICEKGGPCASGWTEFKGRCYLFVLTYVSLPTALAECKKQAATLVSIGDEDENAFMLMNSKGSLWLGIQKKEGAPTCSHNDFACARRDWKWLDGTPYTYQNWSVGINEPDSNELCASITLSSGRWEGVACSVPIADFKRSYICEKAFYNVPTPITPVATTAYTSEAKTDIGTTTTTTTSSSTPTLSITTSGGPVGGVDVAHLISRLNKYEVILIVIGSLFGVVIIVLLVLVVLLYCRPRQANQKHNSGAKDAKDAKPAGVELSEIEYETPDDLPNTQGHAKTGVRRPPRQSSGRDHVDSYENTGFRHYENVARNEYETVAH